MEAKNKKPRNAKFAEDLLVRTIEYENKQIGYELQEDERLIVWSLRSSELTGSFYNTSLIVIFHEFFRTYFRHNKEKDRVELVVF